MRTMKYHLFSLVLLIISIITNYLMILPALAYRTHYDKMSGILISVGITLFAIFSIEMAGRISRSSPRLNVYDGFHFDFNVMSYVVILITFIYIFLVKNNFMPLGWWMEITFLLPLYGIIFAFIFALFAVLLNAHRAYTFLFSCLFIFCYVARAIQPIEVYPHFINQYAMLKIINYYTDPLLILLLIVHIIICLVYRLIKR